MEKILAALCLLPCCLLAAPVMICTDVRFGRTSKAARKAQHTV